MLKQLWQFTLWSLKFLWKALLFSLYVFFRFLEILSRLITTAIKSPN